MSYTTRNYRDVEPNHEALYVLRDALDCEQLGFSVVECEPGWSGIEHDHVGHDADSVFANDHEEVYFLVEGGVTVEIEGDAVELDPGDAVRIAPDAVRQIHNGDEPSTLVLAGAP
ncbi:MAG: cupin domain-containing protein [Halobellus sp.]